jgi:hypothetical protein
LDIQYCNGQKKCDFNTDEGFYYPGCKPKNYHINDLSPQAFRRGYVAALFAEDEHWLNVIEKNHMVVPGSPVNSRDKARDQDTKAHLRDQVGPETFEDRKAFFEAWREAPCCADDCDQYCDECSNGGIKFKSVPTYGLNPDVRRFITKYGRYQTASELERETNDRSKESKISATPILSGVCYRKSDNDAIWVPGQERDRLLSEPEEVSSDQAERIEALLLHPISEEMVT